MGKHYKHLSECDRNLIKLMLEKNYTKTKIADVLGVHRSTIYRELKRNSYSRGLGQNQHYFYLGLIAQNRYLKRRQRQTKLLRDDTLRSYVHSKLQHGWSPAQIAGRLRLENKGVSQLSHETIYRYIYSNYKVRNRFFKKLRRRHFYRKKHCSRKLKIPKELLVSNRPDDVNTRETFGHWEGDLMIFKRGIKSNLITLRERKTRYTIIIKNANKTAKGTAMAIIAVASKLKSVFKSITFDQGTEFMKYNWIRDCLDTTVYFCQPASPQQKGAIENVNGVIRVELPRNCNIDAFEQKHITRINCEINHRPLKCLGYRTPAELFANNVRG